MAHLGFTPTGQNFPRQVILCFLDQLALLWSEEPFLVISNHLDSLLVIVDIVENEGIAVNASLGRNVGWSIRHMTTDVDIKGVGLPIYHRH
jgi:hypothetical protein